MELRNSPLAKFYCNLLKGFILAPLAKSGLKPNHFTLAGPLVAAFTPVGFWIHPLAGALVILVSALADSLDGLAARSWQQSSAGGAFLDSCMDRVADVFYLMGFWVLFWPAYSPFAAGLLIMASICATCLVSYAKARAESLKMATCRGAMERAPRIIFLLVWSLALALFSSRRQELLWAGLLTYLALTTFTAANRVISALKKCRN